MSAHERPALPKAVYRQRRGRLSDLVDGPILLLGNGVRARNLPMTPLPFRQDSTFLYFTGCTIADSALLLDGGVATLFTPEPAADDVLWHGDVDTLEDIAATFGMDSVQPMSRLESVVQAQTDVPATLAVADESKNAWLSRVVQRPLAFGKAYGDRRLVDAVIALRRRKSPEELALLRVAAAHSADAHLAVARSIGVGVHERALAAMFQAILAARGCALAYTTILTQQGEILHNFNYTSALRDGALLLVDGGGEVAAGYGCDITRTWPVSGTFNPRQRAAYEAVLEAQAASIDLCRPGVRYREVHDASSLVLAQFLRDEGLLKVAPEIAVEAGAHALFFPHGVGHLLGLDVHDLENFGDLPAYPPGVGRPDQFGTQYLRLDLPLEEDWVVTVEPGFYVVPAILSDDRLRERFADMVDFEKARMWTGFGGIRIEDDIAVTATAPEILTADVPKSIAAVEAVVGQSMSMDVLLRQVPLIPASSNPGLMA